MKDPKLIIRVINFELVQPVCSRYINVTDGRTDRQTERRQYRAITTTQITHRTAKELIDCK